MFGFHPDKQLAAYCQGELNAEARLRIEAHLQRCFRCRQQLDALRQSHNLLSDLPPLSAPEDLWNRIEAALPEAAPGRSLRFNSGSFRWQQRGFAVAMLILFASVVTWRVTHPPRPSGPALSVASLAGTPRVGSDRIGAKGRLGVGEWLETDGASKAEITVANLGTVKVEPNSRIGLKATGPNEQRLELRRGEMQAKVLAPPRLFLVDTPAATAVDLGCAYTLRVDDAGNTWLHVTSGHVALTRRGREVTVPAEAACDTRQGKGMGTPFFTDATPAFQGALNRFDFVQGGDAALEIVLKEARLRDTLTLWNLLYSVNETQRGHIIDRMLQLIPPPDGVTREAALRLDARTLELWRADLEIFW